MNVSFQRLIRSLREAVSNGELESIRRADEEISAHIEEFAQQGDVSIVKRELEQLLDEYQGFIDKVEEIQKLIGDQLRHVQRGSEVSNQYNSVMKPAAV